MPTKMLPWKLSSELAANAIGSGRSGVGRSRDPQIAHGYVYFDVDPAFPDADVVRVPLAGGETRCAAYAALSANGATGETFFSLESPEGAPGCLIRYDGADDARAVARVQQIAINSEFVFDADFAYAVSLTPEGLAVIRMPSR